MDSEQSLLILSTAIEDFGYDGNGKQRAIRLSTLISERGEEFKDWYINPSIFPTHIQTLSGQRKFLATYPNIIEAFKEHRDETTLLKDKCKERGENIAAINEVIQMDLTRKEEEEASVARIVCIDTSFKVFY